jgi:hypothetical protein
MYLISHTFIEYRRPGTGFSECYPSMHVVDVNQFSEPLLFYIDIYYPLTRHVISTVSNHVPQNSLIFSLCA